MALGLVILAGWFARTRAGRRAFVNAPCRPHHLLVTDILLVAALHIVTSICAALVLGDPTQASWNRHDLAFAILIVAQAALVVVVITIASRRFKGSLTGLGLTGQPFGKTCTLAVFYFVVATGLTALALTATAIICQRFGWELPRHTFLDILQKQPPPRTLILLLILPAMFVPVAEELMFRGLLQTFIITALTRRLQPSYPTAAQTTLDIQTTTAPPAICRWTGILITALIFALWHSQWQHWPALTVLAIVLGYSYERYGNLLVPILVHSLFNILPLTFTLLTAPK